MPHGPSGLLSYARICELLDCSDDTVRRLVRRGLLPEPKSYKGVGKRFKAEDVYRYLYSQEEAEQNPPPDKEDVKPK